MNNSDNLVERIRFDMRAAMKAGRPAETNTLKSLLARFSNAEAVPQDGVSASKGVGSTEAPRKLLNATDLHAIIDDEISELQEVIDQLDDQSSYRTELQDKIIILSRYK